MQIVIDIDENLYTRLFDNGDIDAVDMLKACIAIRKGIPLPKHGRLIDESKITKCGWNFIDHHAKTDAPTIIEVDRESEE